VLVVATMPPVMQVLGAGARGCRREFRTPAIHPGAAARRAGSSASLFLVAAGRGRVVSRAVVTACL